MPQSLRSKDVAQTVALLDSIAYVAVEHETSLELLALASFVDLYARHLEISAERPATTPAPFERFVRDAAALTIAADRAARDSGLPSRPPPALEPPV